VRVLGIGFTSSPSRRTSFIEVSINQQAFVSPRQIGWGASYLRPDKLLRVEVGGRCRRVLMQSQAMVMEGEILPRPCDHATTIRDPDTMCLRFVASIATLELAIIGGFCAIGLLTTLFLINEFQDFGELVATLEQLP